MRIWPARDGTITLAKLGPLAIIVNQPKVSDAGWEDYCEAIDEAGPPQIVLNYSPQWAPSPTQMMRFLQHRMHLLTDMRRFGLITGSAVVRKVVNLLAWMTPVRVEVRSYHAERIWRALDWLVEGTDVNPCAARDLASKLLVDSGYGLPENEAGTQTA